MVTIIAKYANLASPERGTEKTAAAGIFEAARAKNQYKLGLDSFAILKAYDVPTVNVAFAKNEDNAVKAVEEIGILLLWK